MGAGLGFGFGMMMPYMMTRAWPNAGPYGYAHATGYGHPPPPTAVEPRFCGHCGGGLVPQGRFCGHCGQYVQR